MSSNFCLVLLFWFINLGILLRFHRKASEISRKEEEDKTLFLFFCITRDFAAKQTFFYFILIEFAYRFNTCNGVLGRN
jgi:hypothetical protein